MNKTLNFMLVEDSKLDSLLFFKNLEVHELANKSVAFDTIDASLDYLQKNLKLGNSLPDVIVLDFFLLEQSGETLLAFLKSHHLDQISVIIISASRMLIKEQDIFASYPNVLGILDKPFNFQKFLEILRTNFN